MQNLCSMLELAAADVADESTAERTVLVAIRSKWGCRGKRNNPVPAYVVHFTEVLISLKGIQKEQALRDKISIL